MLLAASVVGCAGEKKPTPTPGVVEANFTASPTYGTPPLMVQFADLSKGDITSWEWDFGDGGTSTEKGPVHTYSSVGEYTVSLKVTGPDASDTETKADFIEVGEVVAGFAATPFSGTPPLAVQFADQSVSVGDITAWEWDFGDGSTSTEQNPSHTYNALGKYTVSLKVTGPDASDTETKADYIVVTEAVHDMKIGMSVTLSGPTAAGTIPVAELVQIYFDYINEVEGGFDTVDGKVKVELITMDDESSATRGAEVYKELRDTHGVPLIIWIGETSMAAIQSDLAQDKLPLLSSVALTPDFYVPAGWIFALRPLTDYFAGFVEWVVDEDWIGTGMPKIGYFGPNSAFALADKINFPWVINQGITIEERWFSYADLDYTPYLQAFKDAGVDYLYCNTPISQAATLARDADALGLRDVMKICLSVVCEPYMLRGIVGGEKIKDWLRPNMCNFQFEDDPAVARSKTMQEWAKGAGNYDPKEGNTPLEYTFIIGEAIAKVVEKYGFAGLADGANFYEALQTMIDVDTMGTVDHGGFGVTDRIFVHDTKMGLITKEGYLPISGWFPMPRIFEGGGEPLE